MVLEYIKQSWRAFFFKNEALDYIDEKVKWTTALIVGTLLSFIMGAIDILPQSNFLHILLSAVSKSISFILGVLIGYGILHLFFKLFKGKAKFTTGLKFCFAMGVFPAFVFIIFSLLIKLIPSLQIGLAMGYSLIAFILLIWYLGLFFHIYSTIYEISKWRIFFAILLVIIIAVLLLLILTFLRT